MSDLSQDLSSSGVQRWDLLADAPVVSRPQAELSRLVGRGMRMAWPGAAELLVLPASVSNTQRPDLQLDLDAASLLLADGARMVNAMCGIDIDAVPHDGLAWPGWLAGAIAGRLQDTPLAWLQALQPLARDAHATDTADLLPLTLRLRDGQHAIDTTAWAPLALWHALLTEAMPLRLPPARWLTLAPGASVTLARHRLPRAAFDALRCGDLILPDSPCFDIDGTGRLLLAQRHWRVQYLDRQRLQILSEENDVDYQQLDAQRDQQDADFADDGADEPSDGYAPDFDPAAAEDGDQEDDAAGHSDDQPAETDPQADDPRDGTVGVSGKIALSLRFELGRLNLTLDQLGALGEHSVLVLHDASPQSIAISAAGVQVGRGEVVAVDGRLGVRIIQWSGAC
ncbi:FliM/FliN family flagellar motor switch protein [Herbaspirillum sp. alder98]|uniref:FliM/FliN family flagellar motor switch protein n=1 Tax=Herbaspirillum sp. alder98 TaxID=2913096 RepID=UPI001CD8FF51|nr:FliM/FliN family flagellar motor switch protein [Herbaspirillum sp. alder98]MCA1325660.1 FliM/FliN family flagellar motor switch protein [Herbaspirillum sp. alder98]